VGRGTAIALAAPGTTVYITGRTTKTGSAPLPGTIYETAEAVTQRGGKAVPVHCDHFDDEQIKALFERVAKDSGRLDILVNNATFLHDALILPGGFWEKPLDLIKILDVGFRSHYVASYYAAPMMVRQKEGLIVNISSPGARCYMHGPAYGGGKAGLDKMSADMAHDLRPHNVASLSFWIGFTMTERSQAALAAHPGQYDAVIARAATPEFAGRIIDVLAKAPDLMDRSGKTWYAAELAADLGVKDLEGREPASDRDMLGEPVQVSGAVIG
jgi:NAD(P)-dependent dehydrogenase (short-subunit alcohol dehydrogenase family)